MFTFGNTGCASESSLLLPLLFKKQIALLTYKIKLMCEQKVAITMINICKWCSNVMLPLNTGCQT